MKSIAVSFSLLFFAVSASAQSLEETIANEVIDRIKENVGVEWHFRNRGHL